MKIKNIFKKDKKEVKTSSIQKMNKAQLEKVVGGLEVSISTNNSTEKVGSGLQTGANA